jgi:hypothetical protein
VNDRRRVRHDEDKLVCQYPRARDKSSKIPEASMRMGPITGSIGESWPLFVPFDDDSVSCPPGDSHGAGCQNFLRVGVTANFISF